MIKFNKTIKYISILSLLCFIYLIPKNSYAISAPVSWYGGGLRLERFYDNIYFDEYSRAIEEGGECWGQYECIVHPSLRIKSDFYVSLSKEFNLKVDGLGNLSQNETRPLASGTVIKAENNNLIGSYNHIGGDAGTPPMDCLAYNYNNDPEGPANIQGQYMGCIHNQLGYELNSSNNNIIDCTAKSSCTIKGSGNANITVSFPGTGYYYVQRSYSFDRGSGTIVEGKTYSIGNIVYNFTLNNKPVVSYSQTNEISYNTAKANWIYSDADGDEQNQAIVEIYSSSDYSSSSLINRINLSGIGNNILVDRLTPGTTYYPRVKAEDSKGVWSDWSNGAAFTTQINNPPDLNQLSCNSVATGYTTGKVDWNYTGTDETGDILLFNLRYKKVSDSIWTVVNLPSSKSGIKDIDNLVSGLAYNVEISLNDNRNAYLGDRWKGCGTFTTIEYPSPDVIFNLNGNSQTVQKRETLTVKTSDLVNASWNITNKDGVKDNSCSINSTNISGGNATKIFDARDQSTTINNLAGQRLTSNIDDQTYNIDLRCEGKDAKNKRDVSETITLIIQSYPTVSCSVDGGKKSVKDGDNTLNILTNVGNVTTYDWKIKRSSNDSTVLAQGQNPIPSPYTIDYTGINFGQYQPWVEITKRGTSRSVNTTCGTVTNLGNSNIKEINP